MAKKTGFLGLVLPALGEFFNRWNTPVNDNFQKIDDFAAVFGAEIETARGSASSLDARISAALATDGTLKDVPEVAEARSSKIYGSGSGSTYQTLDARIELNDFETFSARQGLSSLTAGIAWGAGSVNHNCLVSGPTNPLSATGTQITLGGSVVPIISNINGYRQVTNTDEKVSITGAAGTYYLYLQKQTSGKLVYTHPASAGTVGILATTNKLSKYTASGTNLVASGVKVGDILEVTAPSGNLNLGKWVVIETVSENPTDLTNESVTIMGEFAYAATGMSASFYRPGAPTFGYTATTQPKLWAETADIIYIGRCVYNGTNSITSLTTYPYQSTYSGWQSVSLVGGDFSYSISHNLGYIPKRVSVYASQASDFSQALEPLSVAKISSGSVTLTTGDQSATYTTPALRRSVVVSFTDTVINIKNATNGLFYEDFNGNAQTSGYLYVVVER